MHQVFHHPLHRQYHQQYYPIPHFRTVIVTVSDANGKFDEYNFNGLFTFMCGEYINNRPIWKVPQIPQHKNIQFMRTYWISNGQNKRILSYNSNGQYVPDGDNSAEWIHNIVLGTFHLNIKCIHSLPSIFSASFCWQLYCA